MASSVTNSKDPCNCAFNWSGHYIGVDNTGPTGHVLHLQPIALPQVLPRYAPDSCRRRAQSHRMRQRGGWRRATAGLRRCRSHRACSPTSSAPQRAILADGEVTFAEYQRAIFAFISCMEDEGLLIDGLGWAPTRRTTTATACRTAAPCPVGRSTRSLAVRRSTVSPWSRWADIVPPLCGGAQVKAGCRHEGSVPRPGICHADATDEGGSCGAGCRVHGCDPRPATPRSSWCVAAARRSTSAAAASRWCPGGDRRTRRTRRRQWAGRAFRRRHPGGQALFHRGRGSRAPVHEERHGSLSVAEDLPQLKGAKPLPSSD